MFFKVFSFGRLQIEPRVCKWLNMWQQCFDKWVKFILQNKEVQFKSLYLIFEKFLRQRTHIFASSWRIANFFWLLAAIALLLLLIFQLLKWDNFFGFRLNHEFFGQTNWVVGCWLPIELHFCSTYYKYYSLHTHTHTYTHILTHSLSLSLPLTHTLQILLLTHGKYFPLVRGCQKLVASHLKFASGFDLTLQGCQIRFC